MTSTCCLAAFQRRPSVSKLPTHITFHLRTVLRSSSRTAQKLIHRLGLARGSPPWLRALILEQVAYDWPKGAADFPPRGGAARFASLCENRLCMQQRAVLDARLSIPAVREVRSGPPGSFAPRLEALGLHRCGGELGKTGGTGDSTGR